MYIYLHICNTYIEQERSASPRRKWRHKPIFPLYHILPVNFAVEKFFCIVICNDLLRFLYQWGENLSLWNYQLFTRSLCINACVSIIIAQKCIIIRDFVLNAQSWLTKKIAFSLLCYKIFLRSKWKTIFIFTFVFEYITSFLLFVSSRYFARFCAIQKPSCKRRKQRNVPFWTKTHFLKESSEKIATWIIQVESIK
jgi:hypothetical protein